MPRHHTLTARRRRAALIAERLHDAYGSPTHGNKSDPLDELVFIVLSQMTTHQSFNRVFDRLKARVPGWEQVMTMQQRTLQALIKDAGLSRQKAPRIQALIRRVVGDYGRADLSTLRDMSSRAAEKYLCSLPGVGLKTAKCVLMYSLSRPVLPVDTHVWRVSRRLGLVDVDVQYEDVHQELERAVPPRARFRLHVNAIVHGREVCKAKRPQCSQCVVKELCVTGASLSI